MKLESLHHRPRRQAPHLKRTREIVLCLGVLHGIYMRRPPVLPATLPPVPHGMATDRRSRRRSMCLLFCCCAPGCRTAATSVSDVRVRRWSYLKLDCGGPCVPKRCANKKLLKKSCARCEHAAAAWSWLLLSACCRCRCCCCRCCCCRC